MVKCTFSLEIVSLQYGRFDLLYKKVEMKFILISLIFTIFVLSIMSTAKSRNFIYINESSESAQIMNVAISVRKALESFAITDINIIVDLNNYLDGKIVQEMTGKIIRNIIVLDDERKILKSFSNFMIFRNQISFENNLIQKISSDYFYFGGYFLIWIREQSDLNLTNIFRLFWDFYIFNVNVILTSNESIELTTFMPFNDEACNSVVPTIINKFNMKEGSWKSQEIFPKKLADLNGCAMKLSTYDYPPAIVVEKKNNSDVISGHDIELVQGISQLMNFTLDIKILTDPAAWGFLMENGTSGGIIKKVIERNTDIAIGTYYLTMTRAKYMSFSEYSRSKIILVIPAGAPLTAFEKLFSPFRISTWITLLSTFLIGVIVIFIVRLQNKSVQNFVFGIKTGNPYLNMLDIFLNGSQHIQPKRNFSRTLLMIFILFCIIIRTLYQAALFNFLQTDQRHPEIQSIDELIAKKFDIYMYESFQELSKGLKIHKRFVV